MKRILLAGCGAILLLAISVIVQATPPAAISGGGVTGLNLQTQLEKGLRARRPVEFAYIAQVVAQVEAGTLPRSLVDTSFLAARKQPRHPLQYFQFTLQARAQKLGYTTPSLAGQIATVTP